MAITTDDLFNRLQKNVKRLAMNFRRDQIDAWRLYDKDIPELPYIIELYNGTPVVWEQGRRLEDTPEANALRDEHLRVVTLALENLLGPDIRDEMVVKTRERQKGDSQYGLMDERAEETILVNEGKLRFEVNLRKYLDTGLFLDHRPLRKRLQKESQGKAVLNLFAYTGSLSVAAAVGGATVTTMDMSATYVDWAQRNFRHNKIDLKQHQFRCEDVMAWLPVAKHNKARWDIVLLDPPTFSNSKKMQGTFEVERDQEELLENCLQLLAPNGVLFFSNNKKKFRLSAAIQDKYQIKDVTEASIPQDFRGKPHMLFEIRMK